MTDPDHSYRPRSPDFSSFQTSSYHQQPSVDHHHHQQHQQQQQQQQHQPYSPSPYGGLGHPVTPQASYDASPFFNPQVAARQQYFPPLPQQPQSQQPLPSHPSFGHFHQYPEMPPQTRSRTHAALGQHQQQEPPHHHLPPQQQHWQPPPPAPPPPDDPSPQVHNTAPAPAQTPSQGIDIKTKFPVARIKRIMQADEDVGKVAQVTPIAVSKALELFMINLVTKAAEQARGKSSKRITAAHLKEAIVKDEVLDFLADIMAKVPDQPSATRKHDDDGSDHNDGRRKRGGGGGRRKKEDADDDF